MKLVLVINSRTLFFIPELHDEERVFEFGSYRVCIYECSASSGSIWIKTSAIFLSEFRIASFTV